MSADPLAKSILSADPLADVLNAFMAYGDHALPKDPMDPKEWESVQRWCGDPIEGAPAEMIGKIGESATKLGESMSEMGEVIMVAAISVRDFLDGIEEQKRKPPPFWANNPTKSHRPAKGSHYRRVVS